jgi:GNAT superfamily N-acetyltransferase
VPSRGGLGAVSRQESGIPETERFRFAAVLWQNYGVVPTNSKAAGGGGLEVRALTTSARDVGRFCRVQLELQGNEPHSVLPLRLEVEKVLSDANPFWCHAERALWVAFRGGRAVGRIAAVLDAEHARHHGERCVFFGFFEAVDDPAVAATLFAEVERWAATREAGRIRGPLNPNINEECGLLVEGFDRPNAVMMPYNPPYHGRLIEGVGFTKAKDLVAFDLVLADSPHARLIRLRDGLKRRSPGIELRAVTRKSLKSDLPDLKAIYNAAWERNWSAVPMSAEEIDFLAERLEPLLVNGLVWMASVKGEPAGLLLAVPDVNEALGPLKGSLLTPALLGALPMLLGWRRPKRFRLIALGVKEEFRGRGVEGWMFAETLLAAEAMGFTGCEASWVLEDNMAVHQLAGLFAAKITRRYRIYDRCLNQSAAGEDKREGK